MNTQTIRPAAAEDAEELARLTTQLGYPVSPSTIESRLQRLLSSDRDCILVALDPDEKMRGWIHGSLSQLLESDYRVEIGGLVVDELSRRRGIGRRLVQAIEAWAVKRGAFELSVRCREERKESHVFYKSLSFKHTKTQHVFRKRVEGA